MRLVFLSDTHGHEVAVPDGDVLIHCGDLTGRGTIPQLTDAARWLRSLPHQRKVVIAGNHDWALYREATRPYAEAVMRDGLTYLRDSSCVIEGLSIYGSPWTPEFCGWAFMESESALEARYREAPLDIDILVTHGPPRDIRDRSSAGHPCGSPSLWALSHSRAPLVHAFGHIHEGYGAENQRGTWFVNAAICTLDYEPTNAPIVVDVENGVASIGAKSPGARS